MVDLLLLRFFLFFLAVSATTAGPLEMATLAVVDVLDWGSLSVDSRLGVVGWGLDIGGGWGWGVFRDGFGGWSVAFASL